MRILNRIIWSIVAVPFFMVAVHAQVRLKADFDCNFANPEPQDRSGESVVYRCHPRATDGAPTFYVAVLKGTPSEVHRDHGYLLAREAELGPMSEATDLVNHGIAQRSPALRPTLRSIISCFSNKLFKSLNPEFLANFAAFEQGYRQRLGSAAKYSVAQMRLASVGIELDNILTAIGYRHSTLGSVWTIEKHCPGHLVLKVLLDSGLKLFGKDKGLGCTAFVVPGKNRNGTTLSRDGMVFGRTLDAELMRSWNRVPTLFIVHQHGQDNRGRPYLSYVATGSAGLIYAGGISGFNRAGITASLHQMYASDAILSVPSRQARKAALAPVIQQIILREARSIDDAVEIANRYQAIATWAILIADAKTGESATIEITKGGVKLVRRRRHEPIAQTNHLFDRDQQRYAFFPSYNKYLETNTRLNILGKAFDRLQKRAVRGELFDVQKAIAQLANHEDINGRFQPFGTTAVKAYDVMSTVMLPQVNKIYMSVGDFAPSTHATYLGFQLDANLDPVVVLGTLRDKSLIGTPGVLQSLRFYIEARLAYEFRNYVRAERLLRQAIALASDNDLNAAAPAWEDRKAGALSIYNYVLARLLAMKATQGLFGEDLSREILRSAFDESRRLFEAVIEDQGVLPYQRALAEYHYGLAELKFINRNRIAETLPRDTITLLKDALRIFLSSYQKLRPSVEIRSMASDISNVREVLNGNASLRAEDVDWVVVR